jgi:protein lysine acetyltransferase
MPAARAPSHHRMASHLPSASILTSYGIPLDVRPVDAGDRDRLAAAFAHLSERSRRDRFLGPKPQLSAAELTYLTDIDHRTHEALAAVDPSDGAFVGVGRYATVAGDTGTADMALFVLDLWHRQGIGTMLGRRLLERAEENGIERVTATTFADNRPARVVLRRLGFRTVWFGAGVIELERRSALQKPHSESGGRP